MSKSITVENFLSFDQGDPAGILFFGDVFSLAHQAFEQFIMHNVCEWKEWFENQDWVVPIKQTEAVYFAPLFVGKNCKIEVEILSKGESSFTMRYCFFQGHLCCEVKTVHVFCSRETYQKIPIPIQLTFSDL